MLNTTKKRIITRLLHISMIAPALWYLCTRGLTPIAAALFILWCRKAFRLLFVMTSFLLTAIVIAAILGFLIY
mgnify:CR=1 FL=1